MKSFIKKGFMNKLGIVLLIVFVFSTIVPINASYASAGKLVEKVRRKIIKTIS